MRRRFPGFEEGMGKAISDMAETLVEHRPVRGWTSIEPLDPQDPLPGRWIARVHAFITETKQQITMPVIPDEFNTHPSKLVRAEDTPHVFTYMSEAETAADEALAELLSYIKAKI